MSDRRKDISLSDDMAEGYETPRLTPLGNARELLAGAEGSVVDALDPENGGQVGS
jgi:hypothetical protein